MAGIREFKGTEAVPYPAGLPEPGTPLTEEEFASLRGDGWRLELVGGKLVVLSPANLIHAVVCENIMGLLRDWVREAGSGKVLPTDTGTRLGEGHLRAPDVLWVSDDTLRRGLESRRTFLPGAPELAVEVLSPNDTYSETLERVHDQLSNGGKEVWLVDPRRRWVEIHRTNQSTARLSGKESLITDLLPGFDVKIAEFFEGI